MTQIEALQAQLAQAQAENARLRQALTKIEDYANYDNKPGDREHGLLMIEVIAGKALTPLPDGIGKAMADVVNTTVALEALDASAMSDTGALRRVLKSRLSRLVQTYQQMMGDGQ